MALPKISHPLFTILVPSKQTGSKFMPFTVKEEKILLMAKQSDDASEYLKAIYQIVTNCSADPALDVGKLAVFDLEWLFLKIRQNSVGSTIELPFIDNEDGQEYTFKINLDDIKAPVVGEFAKEVVFSDVSGVKQAVTLTYPPAELYIDKEFLAGNEDDAILYLSTHKIWSGEESFDPRKASIAEVIEYYDQFDSQTMQNIRSWFNETPSMSYEINYTNAKGNERKIVLSTLSDFFTF